MTQPAQKPNRSKQDYATPADFIAAVKALLQIESFAFDFAADDSNAKAIRFWDEDLDSLSMSVADWCAKTGEGWGWINPPFSTIGPWAKRCRDVAMAGGRVAFLVPAGVGSNWYRDYCDPDTTGCTHVLLLNGRLAFMPDKPPWLYPKDCILVLYAYEYQGVKVWTWRDELKAVKVA